MYPAGPIEWIITDSLLDATSSTRAVELQTAADGTVSVVFGDGVNGVIPENGVELKVAYRIGGGARGNITANSLVDIASVISGVSVQSSSEMTGGFDAESTDSIRQNAPKAWGTQDRAVTTADYADLALAVPGVEKAKALGQSTSLITLFLLGARNSTPAADLFERTTSHVQSRAMAGVTVVSQAGTLVPVNFGTSADPVTVGVMNQYRRADVQLAVTQALQAMFDPSATAFNQRVTVADAYAAVRDIPGVLYVHIPMMARADQSQTGTDDVLCREWEVPVSGTVSITAVGGI
jgi:predicted phage baseplate assembly protein